MLSTQKIIIKVTQALLNNSEAAEQLNRGGSIEIYQVYENNEFVFKARPIVKEVKK